jgi:N-acetyl-anhydromuramyl-L-alanine amidase AmpD
VSGGGLSALLENVVHERRHSRVLEAPLVVPRKGVMLHYDDSSRDEWAVEWFFDKRCRNGYTWLVLDDGRVIELADPMMRTPHAGACRTPNANSVFYGVAAATNGLVPATPAQLDSIVALCAVLCSHPTSSTAQRSAVVVGHDEQAIWTPANTRRAELWGKGGRKVDPTGVRKDGVPIIDVNEVRTRVVKQTSNSSAATASSRPFLNPAQPAC